jgi:hypothetical protein
MSSIETYLSNLNEADQSIMNAMRKVILDHLPQGFEEQFSYNGIGYVVPHSLYPKGYHCDPKLPLPFMGIARQKQAYTFYHMGIYTDEALFQWFKENYEAQYGRLNHGKSCFRFSKKEKIPFELIGILVEKMSAQAWILRYETTFSKTRK